ncbi:MAG: alpha-ketoacid dehydrogenase subunit beta [bacterium]|nr:alpha-ketoacid dehydrogenase subunit beta [bacterium]
MHKLTMAEAIREALREEMRRDPNVILIGEDIGIPGGWGGPFTVTQGLAEEFGNERVIDTPISETGIVGIAIGAAIMGLRPVAEVQYCDFLFCAMDQIANQAAKLRYMSGGQIKIPLVLRAPTGATGRGAQHAQSLEGLFTSIPGLKVVAPSTPYDAKGLLKSSIRDDNPVLFFEHKLLYGSKGARKERGGVELFGEVPEEDYAIPLGVADIKKKGKDITVVAKLLMLHRALEAAEELEKDGISVEVIDPRTLIPLDKETIIKSVKKTNRILIVDECPKTGGWAAEISSTVVEEAMDYLDAPIKRLCTYDVPIPFSPVLENYVIPTKERIIQTIREMLG